METKLVEGERMKITIEHEGCTCHIEDDIVLIDDALEMCYKALAGVGYSEELIKESK